MTLNVFRRVPNSQGPARRHRATRHALVLEDLEQRTVLSQVAPVPAVPPAETGPIHVAPHATRLSVNNFVINGVSLVNNQLVASGVFTATVAGKTATPVSIPVTVPLSLSVVQAATPSAGTASPSVATPVSVLHLTLGPVNLSLLGLNVHLGSTCSPFATNDPITANIVAIPTGATYTSPINGQPYTGGALGDLLSGVANLLNGGTGLGGLTGTTLAGLETGLTNILNGLLAPAAGATGAKPGVGNGLAAGANAGGGGGMALPKGTSEVLELPLGTISLDVLGALVQTSPICLNVTATRGPGNLLGNLLG